MFEPLHINSPAYQEMLRMMGLFAEQQQHPEQHSTTQQHGGGLRAPPTGMAPLPGPTGPGMPSVGGITAPAPRAVPMPGAPAPAAAHQGIMGRLHDSLLDHLAGSAPGGYEGLLTPEEIKSAKPSLLQALFPAADQPSASGRYQQNLDQVVAHKQIAEQARQQQIALQKQQKIEQGREAVFQAFPPPTSGTWEDATKWFNRIYPKLYALGGPDATKGLDAIMQQLAAQEGKQQTQHPVEHVDAGDHVEIVDALTGQVIRTIPKGRPPKDAAAVDAERRFGADQKNKILDDYARDTKDFHAVMAGWDVLTGGTKDPTLATPFAVTDAYARITNPGAIVRPTTQEMLEKMGSVGQRMKKWWAHNADGSLPPDILKDFQRTMFNIVKQHYEQYEDIRKKALRRAQQEGVTGLDEILQQYNLTDPLAAVTPPPAGPPRLNPMFRKP